MAGAPTLQEAFRLLQAGQPQTALAASRALVAAEPANARAHLAEGIALRLLGRPKEALDALAQAGRLDPADAAVPYETGLVLQQQGRDDAALESFRRALALRPDFFAAHFAAGTVLLGRGAWADAAACFRAVLASRPGEPSALLHLALALRGAGDFGQARVHFERALRAHPANIATLTAYGQFCVSRGDFDAASPLFRQALGHAPSDPVLAMFVAQVELLRGHWREAWAAYGAREPRRVHETRVAAAGARYRVPTADALRGQDVLLLGEQGLGDALFFLRWAAPLREAGARLHFAGHPRLHSLLRRTALFESLGDFDGRPPALDPVPLLLGDLPAAMPHRDPLGVPSLRIAPDASRLAAWRQRLEAAGPRPWIAATWRAGTPSAVVAHALAKEIPVSVLFPALAAFEGTVVALQRQPRAGEIAAAAAALGRPVHDFAAAAEDLEDALALAALVDRHVAVSSTNLHLAALAGATADVLVPFPPEWRWRLGGESPWFPGFRVHRQSVDGGWQEALASLQDSARDSTGLQ